ncbi:MAG: HAD-IC family P-type ATPase [Acidobacteria bacterium]|nr:HAD-IC family P-type ATPase [Acidobacteriota bacterium]
MPTPQRLRSLAPAQISSWHGRELPALLTDLKCSEHGLSSAEAALRLRQYGPNRLPEQPPPTWWEIALRQFQSPLIYILGVAGVISLAIGEFTDAAFIAAVLVLNAVIGTYQEWKAEQSTHSLRKLLQIRAAVQRDGEVYEVDAEELVPGDVVWLESGNRVPADVRFLMAHGLEVDESFLTGESLPVLKQSSWLGDLNTPVSDRLNMGHAGSMVTRGRAKGLVVSTGIGTVVGQLAVDVLGTVGGKPPLLERMEHFVRVIAAATLVGAAAIGVVGVAFGRYAIPEMFLFVVALAISAIPEGLPVAMTVALAIATSRMARRGVIVRKLTAVEGLGSCTFVATDKTGTLTCNELTVKEVQLPNGEVFQVTGEGFAPLGEVLFQDKPVDRVRHPLLESLARASVLCNEADLHHRNGTWVWRGDTVDIALLSMAHKLGWNREAMLDLYPQLSQIPFEPELRFAASYHKVDGETMVFVKGAPEQVLSMCSEDKHPAKSRALANTAVTMAKRGYRVLALAAGNVPDKCLAAPVPPQPSCLTFLGFVGMIDPLRSEVPEAIRACREAGVTVSMVTGDHQVTALAIARELGLAERDEQVITGTELEEASAKQLRELVQRIRVFARVTPNQKLQIVQAARKSGHFVAVTGDGVNDAPALRAANIGIAMGKSGTDVARETAGLVISDDNFATIVAGIEEGRVAYDNIRKVIYLLVSTGLGELVLMGLAVAANLPLPLHPAQLLWLNLVTNGIQDVALAFEPSEGDVLKRRPRPPQEPIFNRLMVERTLVAALVIGGVAFGAFRWMLETGWSEDSARNSLLLLMVLFENIHIGNCRSETKSAFKLSPLRSPILLIGTICAFLIHLAAMFHPWGHQVLRTEPVSLPQGLALLLLALTIFPAMELHKWFRARQK